MDGKRILFVCTGNYYRSRFAEELFNYLCRKANLAHGADSCALALERGIGNPGYISQHASDALAARGIVPALRYPRPARDVDFEKADIIVALKEVEHRPLVESRFPRFACRVRYWHVHDLDGAVPDDATALIEELVQELIDEL